MAATIKGLGVIWSVGTIDFTGGITSGSTNANLPQSLSVTRQSENTKIKGTGGGIVTAIYHGFMKMLSLSIVPSADSIANAKTAGNNYMPSPGTAVTIADDYGTIIDDNYNVVSARQNRTVDGVVTIDLDLEASEENEIAGAAL